MFDLLDSANSFTSSVGDMFAGRDYSAPTADQPQMSMPGDAGPFGAFGQTIGDLGRGLSQEGLSGLLDPMGMLDRQQAQRDLMGRFNVMDADDMVCTPGTPTPAVAGNTVTPEQFQAIARDYSDIGMGRSDLQLGAKPAGMSDDDYAAFRRSSMEDIGDIMQTDSGRGLIGSLADAPRQADGTTHRTTTINPRIDAAGALDPSNASGGGTFGVSGNVSYAPGMDHLPTRDNLRSDVTLYHEMVHAHHAVYNTWDGPAVGGTGPDALISRAEHQAAGLGAHANDPYTENRYRGERAAIGATNIGERTTGAETDDAMTHRDQYRYPGTARTTPASIP